MESRARSEEANRVFKLVKEVLREEWDGNLVLFASEGRKDSIYVCGLVGHKASPLWLEAHFVAVLFRHAPLILHRNARFVLNLELLLRRYANVTRWEEDLLILQSDLRAIAVSLQKHLLHVLR